MRILIFLLLLSPIFASAQILRAYGVIEVGSLPTSSATGPKFAYRPADSSFYRWVSGSTWVKIIPDEPDTLYLKQLSGTTALVDGDTIDISTYFLKSDTTSAFASYLKRPVGWGLSLLTGKYPFVDSSKVASRYYVSTSPTTIANNYIATSNGSNLVARNLFDNNTYVGILNSKPFAFGEWTTAGRPTVANNRWGFNTTNNWIEGYSVSGWVAPAQAANADGKFLVASIPYADANGRLKFGSYSELYFSTTELVCYRAPFFSSNVAGIGGGLRITNTNTTSGSGYASATLYPSTGGHFAQFFCTNTLYPGYGVVTPSSFGHYTNGSGGMGIQLDNPASSVRFGIGTTGTIEKMRLNATGLGIGRTATTSKLEVMGAGEFHGNSGVTYIGAYGSSPPDPLVLNTGYIYNTNSKFGLFSGQGFSVNDDIILHATSTRKVSIRAINDTIPGIGISLSKATFIRERLIIGSDSTFKFDPTIDVPQFNKMGLGNKEAADLSKTESSYAAWLMTDGTVGEKSLSTIRDGNGIYTGSGTLANHTTRALIPSTGNLLFSQTYNSTDSAYIQVINNLDGNREVRGGLTDTMSTGFSKFRFYQDADDEYMGWEALTTDGGGSTTVRGEGGSLSVYADNALEMRGTEIRLNNGEVLMNQYGQGNMKSSDLSATDSKFVAKFGDAGKVLDYYLARDTFIEDVTLFSVGTLMNDCQELTVVSSMTATAPSHQEIRFPDAGDHLRGKKIIVYQKKKEAGIYVPQIKVVGGVSRLYFTTNTLTTDPSDQSVLSMDDVTWYTHGVTYEFTCLRIDNTPSYRWVLKQR